MSVCVVLSLCDRIFNSFAHFRLCSSPVLIMISVAQLLLSDVVCILGNREMPLVSSSRRLVSLLKAHHHKPNRVQEKPSFWPVLSCFLSCFSSIFRVVPCCPVLFVVPCCFLCVSSVLLCIPSPCVLLVVPLLPPSVSPPPLFFSPPLEPRGRGGREPRWRRNRGGRVSRDLLTPLPHEMCPTLPTLLPVFWSEEPGLGERGRGSVRRPSPTSPSPQPHSPRSKNNAGDALTQTPCPLWGFSQPSNETSPNTEEKQRKKKTEEKRKQRKKKTENQTEEPNRGNKQRNQTEEPNRGTKQRNQTE